MIEREEYEALVFMQYVSIFFFVNCFFNLNFYLFIAFNLCIFLICDVNYGIETNKKKIYFKLVAE